MSRSVVVVAMVAIQCVWRDSNWDLRGSIRGCFELRCRVGCLAGLRFDVVDGTGAAWERIGCLAGLDL